MKTVPTSNAAPVDLAAILRQTGFQIDPEQEEGPSAGKVEVKDEAAQSAPAEKPSVDITARVPRQRQAENREAADVSIDEYMSHLLARSRGDSAPSHRPAASVSRAPAAPAPDPAPRPSAPPVAPATQDEPITPGEPVEIVPRAHAPERQIDFNAMRQLANLSAKNALHKSESKKLSGTTRTKLLVTCVSLVVGVSLLLIRLLPGAPPVTLYGAAAAFAAAALWGMNYISLMAQMAGERMAYMSRHLKTGEQPAAEGQEEKS